MFDHSHIWKSGSKVDHQIAAAEEVGVRFHASRGSLSLGESDGGLPPDDVTEDEDFILEDCQRVVEEYHDASRGSMVRIVLSPCSPFSVTADLLKNTAELARQYDSVGLHTHLAETLDEEQYTLERYDQRPVQWMEAVDWLGNDVWFAHAVHVNADEIRQFAATGTGVAHCPNSNMRLASGIAPVKAYRDAGVKVGIGVDGSASSDASNLLLEVRQALYLARLKMALRPPEGPMTVLSPSHPLRRDEWVTARDAIEIGTRGGAAVLGRDDIGHLAPGMCADFFSIDLNTIDLAGGMADPVASLIFCAPQKAKYTVINGDTIVQDGQIATVEMGPILEEHQRHAQQLLSGGVPD